MKAVVIERVGAVPTIQEVPDPIAPADGVVIEVSATGVCRSDWHAWMGHDPVALPHVPGHELVGVISEVGAGVTNWRKGDRVTSPFVCGCGKCEFCRMGDAQVCPDQTQPGFTGWGSFAERVALHAADHNLVAIPEAIDDASAAALGCRFATAYRALAHHGDLHGAGDAPWVAIHGMGGVGLSALLIAQALGARVVAVDRAPAALARAVELGASATVWAGGSRPAVTDGDAGQGAGAAPGATARTPEEIGEAVTDLTCGGAHVSIDAFGSASAATASVYSLRRRGRHAQAGLLLGDQAQPPFPMGRVVGWELSLHGTHGLAACDYPAMLDLVTSRRIDLSALVGARLPLADGPAALAALGDLPSHAGITVLHPR